jgi:hypothetical protein
LAEKIRIMAAKRAKQAAATPNNLVAEELKLISRSYFALADAVANKPANKLDTES